MQRIPLIAFLLMVHFYTLAQRPVGVFEPINIQLSNPGDTRDYIDTLKATSFISQDAGGLGCETGIYPAPDSGYVTGNNKYGDLQKAQFYSLHQMGYTAPAYVQSVQVLIGLKTSMAGSSGVYANIYAVDTNGFRPGTLLATSIPIPINDIEVTDSVNTFSFSVPVLVDDSFFVSVLLPIVTGDTIAIVSTMAGCRSYEGWSWEQWSNNSWHTLINSWLADIDLAIFPVMDLPFNVGFQNPSITAMQGKLYPNPALKQTSLIYSINQSGTVTICLMNDRGEIIQKKERGSLKAGQHIETIDLQQLPGGIYFVKVSDVLEQHVFPLVVD
ncbi:MAG: T9SS type A sorting domain-containing protein [Chitinophagaceae bacterium]|nr:T9SS type A sorting domain-containing protein [Chitinophagaceae bacterium]